MHPRFLAPMWLCLFTMSSLLFAERYTLVQVQDFLTKSEWPTIEQSARGSITDEFFQEIFSINNRSGEAFGHVLQKFISPSSLIESLLSNWTPSLDDKGRDAPVKITSYKDGTEVYFDEGLWLCFDSNNYLIYMKHWDHYTAGASDTYRRVFEGIPGFTAHHEHSFFFGPNAQGHIVM